jgi:hypothetical protein
LRSAILIVLTAMVVAAGYGQVPNGGFEQWQSDTDATGWISDSNILGKTVMKTTDAYGGQFALEGFVAQDEFGNVMPALVQSAVFPMTTRPQVLSGWYKFSRVAGSADFFYVNTSL